MDTPTTTSWKFLEPRPGFLRQLWVKGSGFTARDLYGLHVSAEEPMTVEEIAADHNLPLAAVEEAIAYCRTNPPEIEHDYAREDALFEASGMNDPNYDGKPKPLSR